MAEQSVARPLAITRRTAHEAVTAQLRSLIITGQIKAGTPLRQDHLAREFNVSHIPVREALRQLDAEGLVKIIPHRGAIVSSVSVEELDELIRVRVLLEPELLRTAIPNIDAAIVAQARAILKQIDRAKGKAVSSDLNWQFHSTLYKPARLEYIFGIVARVHESVKRYARIGAALAGNIAQSQIEHYAIVDAVEKKDAKTATNLLAKHITSNASRVAGILKEPSP